MKKIFSLLVILLFLSCKSSTDSADVRFAYIENYKTDANEKNVPLNKQIIDQYEKLNGNLDINIPLNKYMYAPNYSVFIGVSIDNNLKEVAEAMSKDADLKLFDSKKVNDFYNLFCKKDSVYIVKTMYNEKKEKLPVVISLVGKDSLLIRNIYNENKLIDKIK